MQVILLTVLLAALVVPGILLIRGASFRRILGWGLVTFSLSILAVGLFSLFLFTGVPK